MHQSDFVFCQVLSRGVIALHGFQKVTARALNALTSGTVSFELSVSLHMAPAVQILAFCALPSENVVATSASFDTEACFQNKVSGHLAPLLHASTRDVFQLELVLVPGVSAVFSCYSCSC